MKPWIKYLLIVLLFIVAIVVLPITIVTVLLIIFYMRSKMRIKRIKDTTEVNNNLDYDNSFLYEKITNNNLREEEITDDMLRNIN